jgi:hypothetical protein
MLHPPTLLNTSSAQPERQRWNLEFWDSWHSVPGQSPHDHDLTCHSPGPWFHSSLCGGSHTPVGHPGLTSKLLMASTKSPFRGIQTSDMGTFRRTAWGRGWKGLGSTWVGLQVSCKEEHGHVPLALGITLVHQGSRALPQKGQSVPSKSSF